jgi:hypothetical protein
MDGASPLNPVLGGPTGDAPNDAARHEDPDTLPIRGHWQREMLQLSHQRAVFARLADSASLSSEARAPSWRPSLGEA